MKMEWIYVIVYEPDLEAYRSQGWEVVGRNCIPSGTSERYGPYFRMRREK